MSTWCKFHDATPPNPLTSQGIQKIILLSKSTARIVTRHYCNISAINSPHPCKEVSLLYLIETPCSLWVVSLRLSPLRFLCLIHRRPSGNPDKDICDHIMQVKLSYKEQLTHILHQVKLHWIWGVIKKEVKKLTWDQALFSFRFENYIPAGKAKWKEIGSRERELILWEPLTLGLISGY